MVVHPRAGAVQVYWEPLLLCVETERTPVPDEPVPGERSETASMEWSMLEGHLALGSPARLSLALRVQGQAEVQT